MWLGRRILGDGQIDKFPMVRIVQEVGKDIVGRRVGQLVVHVTDDDHLAAREMILHILLQQQAPGPAAGFGLLVGHRLEVVVDQHHRHAVEGKFQNEGRARQGVLAGENFVGRDRFDWTVGSVHEREVQISVRRRGFDARPAVQPRVQIAERTAVLDLLQGDQIDVQGVDGLDQQVDGRITLFGEIFKIPGQDLEGLIGTRFGAFEGISRDNEGVFAAAADQQKDARNQDCDHREVFHQTMHVQNPFHPPENNQPISSWSTGKRNP
jgi:hypothetical protein